MKLGKAFTLIELLVVIAIVGILMAILLPSLSKARQLATAAVCLSNLRECSLGTAMYCDDFNGTFPYPTTTLDESLVWFDVIDPYLGSRANTHRTGVAGDRAYMKFKQCPVLSPMLGDTTNYGGTGAQNSTTEYTRSYKMNSMLRRNHPYAQARVSQVTLPSNFVEYGDGMAMDITGECVSQYDNGQFSMEVNDTGGNATCPALRHGGGACLVFVDGHGERVTLPVLRPAIPLAREPHTAVMRWQGEYLSGSQPYNPATGSTTLPAGVTRNSNMPLQWSDFEHGLYR